VWASYDFGASVHMKCSFSNVGHINIRSSIIITRSLNVSPTYKAQLGYV